MAVIPIVAIPALQFLEQIGIVFVSVIVADGGTVRESMSEA
jgi:hypothetical protein